MLLTLSRFGPPMWFLGDPKNVTVALNYQEPGPVDIDFAALSPQEQKKVLIGVQAGHLESDVPFAELYHLWSVGGVLVEPPDNSQVEQVQKVKERLHDMRMKLEADRQVKQTKEAEQCAYLLNNSVRAVKTAVTSMTDVKLVRKLLAAERVGKKRKGVIAVLEKKEKQLAIALEKKTAQGVQREALSQFQKAKKKGWLGEAKETIKFDVVESEQETVVLTPGDLIAAAEEL